MLFLAICWQVAEKAKLEELWQMRDIIAAIRAFEAARIKSKAKQKSTGTESISEAVVELGETTVNLACDSSEMLVETSMHIAQNLTSLVDDEEDIKKLEQAFDDAPPMLARPKLLNQLSSAFMGGRVPPSNALSDP